MSLIDDLISWYKLDEASGNATDAHAANDLTDSGAVGSAAGIKTNARDFSGSNSLNGADSSVHAFGDEDFTICFWMRVPSQGTVRRAILGKFTETGNQRAYSIFCDHGSSGVLGAIVSGNGTATSGLWSPYGAGTLSVDTWYFVCFWHDSVANTINMSLNDGTTQSSAWSSGIYAASTALFKLGTSAIGGNSYIGRLDEIGIWGRTLTAGERTFLYNSGAGRTYEDLILTITTTTLPDGTIGQAYSQTIAVTGGTAPITFAVQSGALPTGLSLNASTGAITGTPTAGGSFSFTIRATDSGSLTDDQAYTVTVGISVTATDGSKYHLFQAACSVKDYTEGIGFGTIENELGDGYWAQTLYGSNTGNRMLSLSMPTLQGGSSSTTVTGPNGETVTKADYIWGLFCEQKATGKPFIITSQRNDQYYLVRFAEPNLSYDRMLTKLYSTGVKLVQARIKNSSVFQPNLMDKLTGYWDANTDFATNDWAGTDGTSAINFTKTGDVIDVASGQNSQQIKRLNNTANTGYLDYSGIAGGKVYDIIIAMKMREATFSNNAGILSDAATTAFIKGDDTTTKFQDPALTNFYYALNGVERDADDMQAPMSVWGVCHFRNTDGWSVATSLRIGMFASAYAEMDLGDVILLTTPSMQDAREAVEHLMVKYAAGT